MNADAFRHLYSYHFDENRKIWDAHVAPMPYEQFIQDVGYSYGSVRNQVIHMVNADEMWFSELRDLQPPDPIAPVDFDGRSILRARWDNVEQHMRAYLAALRDEMLFQKPISFEDDKDLIAWQVLIHVVNHGTDHRAQLLRMLSDLGVKTESQDYIFYAFAHPLDASGAAPTP